MSHVYRSCFHDHIIQLDFRVFTYKFESVSLKLCKLNLIQVKGKNERQSMNVKISWNLVM